MALDETRELFPLTRLCDTEGRHDDRLVELWFRGVHADVGGGNGNRGLNWIPLHWMFMNAQRAGLPIDQTAVDSNVEDSVLPQQISSHYLDAGRLRSFFKTDCLHTSVLLVDGPPGRPHRNPPFPLRRMDDTGRLIDVAIT